MGTDQCILDGPDLEPEDDSILADGSVDSKGKVAVRAKTGGWRTAPLIFGPETCEKMAVASIVMNLVTYLTSKMHLSSSYSANMVTTYQGTSYIFTLLAGFIADAITGRFWVIITAAIIQFLGLLLITLSTVVPVFKPHPCAQDACPATTGWPLTVVYLSLYLVALGTGGIKACSSAFGADQFDVNHIKEKRSLTGYFNWYFFFITFGALFAVTVLVWVQDNVGRVWGYGAPCALMFCIVVGLFCGRPLYRFKLPTGSPLTQIAQVFAAAYRNRNLTYPENHSMFYELLEAEEPFGYVKLRHTEQFKFLNKAAIKGSSHPSKDAIVSSWRLTTVTKVEEVKMVIRLIPILMTTSLFYTVYAQMTTFSTEQGVTMERKIGDFIIPAASMATFIQIPILMTIFLYEKAFVPIFRKVTGRERGLTSLQRIGVGLIISILCMAVAAMVEAKRLRYVRANNLIDNPHGIAHLSVFWLLPQYVLVGAGEALTYAGQLDFFYNESPKGMRSMGSALCICTLSIGYYTSTLMVSIVNKATIHPHSDRIGQLQWLPSNINMGRLDKFYGLLAVCSAVNFVFFLVCAHWYKYKSIADHSDEIAYSETNATSKGDEDGI